MFDSGLVNKTILVEEKLRHSTPVSHGNLFANREMFSGADGDYANVVIVGQRMELDGTCYGVTYFVPRAYLD